MCSLLGLKWNTREVMLVARCSRQNVRVLHRHRCYGSFRPQLRGLGTSAMAHQVTHDILKWRSVWHELDGPGCCCLIPSVTSLRHRYILQSVLCLRKIVWRQWRFLIFCGSVFDVLAVENMKMSILRGVKAYSLVDRYQHLGETCYLHLCVVFRRQPLFRLEKYFYSCHTDFALFGTYIQFVTASPNFTYFVTVVHCLYSTLQQGMRNLHFHLWKAINNRMLACIIHTR